MSNIKTLVVCNYEILPEIIDEIMLKKIGRDALYDIISFPYLMETLLTQGRSLEENYFTYCIRKMLILHQIEKILFLTNIDLHYPLLQIHLETEYFAFDVEVEVLTYNITGKEITFYETKEKYQNERKNKIIFLCSDAVITNIYMNSLKSKENPLGVNCGYHICLPGSTLPFTLCEERKALIDVIKSEIRNRKVDEIIIEHHSDCEVFKAYHQIEKDNEPDIKRSHFQHIRNLEKVWKIFRDCEIDISARYIDIDIYHKELKEWRYILHDSGISESKETKSIPYDFDRMEFTQKNALTGVGV